MSRITLTFNVYVGASRTTSIVIRESGRAGIPETPVLNREVSAYWIPRFRGE
jgi:hypothetical protein